MLIKNFFSIKRLFYFCTFVKIQYFKFFILPYFGYEFKLIDYFSKKIIKILSEVYQIIFIYEYFNC